MGDSKYDDVNLAEVKAVLGRLQRISRKPQTGAWTPGDDGAALAGVQPPAGSAPAEEGVLAIASRVPGVNAPRLVKAGILIVPLIAVFAGIAMFTGNGGDRSSAPAPPAPVKEPAENLAVREESPVVRESPTVQAKAKPRASAEEPQKSPAEAALRAASELLVSGQVQAARDALLRATKEESADVAWALARSYDPNFLSEVPAADASPDVAEATRWYRTWYDIAVKQGLIADSVSLERIIRSMN
jgi:hypothetical protein